MYRRELGKRKAGVGAVQAADSGEEAETDADADDLFAEGEDDENASASETEVRCEKSILKGQERGEGEGSSSKSVPDMYKAFDGSALMAIGTPRLCEIILRPKFNHVTQVCYSKRMYRRF
jgi:hypothetical protein